MWRARHETIYIDRVALGPKDEDQLRTLSEPERSRWLMARAMKFWVVFWVRMAQGPMP